MLDNESLILMLIILVGLVISLAWLFSQIKQLKSDLLGQSVNLQDILKEELAKSREKQIEHLADLQKNLERRFGEMMEQQAERFSKFSEATQNSLHQHRQSFEERQLDALKLQQDNLNQGMSEVRF